MLLMTRFLCRNSDTCCPSSRDKDAGIDNKDADYDSVLCIICLEHFDSGDQTYIINVKVCEHMFHGKCILEWLIDHDTCPCCRCHVFTETATSSDLSAGTPTSRSHDEQNAAATQQMDGIGCILESLVVERFLAR